MRKIYLIDSPGVVMGNYGETDEEKVLKGVVRVELGMIVLFLCTV